MYRIRLYCIDNKIRLNKPQWKANPTLNVRKVYSSYPTHEGHMFYINTYKNKDMFVHILFNGTVHVTDGYDGGDLSKYKEK